MRGSVALPVSSLLLLLLAACGGGGAPQAPGAGDPPPSATTWTNTFGGSGDDAGYSVRQTSDGGYIVAGRTTSFGAGGADIYLVKTNAAGDAVWTKTIGGTGDESAGDIRQTSDGGYIVAGRTASVGTRNHDVYLVKTDAAGDVVWTKTIGGPGLDSAGSVLQTSDGGFIVSGVTNSTGAGGYDVQLIKTDAAGDVAWTKTFGGAGDDIPGSAHQTSDGGYVIAGRTDSFGAYMGFSDICLIRTDAAGDVAWTRTFGGDGDDGGYDVHQTSDGGFIVAGYTSPLFSFERDGHLVRTDGAGNAVWTKTIGGAGDDYAGHVRQLADGGYVVAGITRPVGAGEYDGYLARADASGEIAWTRAIGGAGEEIVSDVLQVADGGYVVVGQTTSLGAGGADVYLIKTDADGAYP